MRWVVPGDRNTESLEIAGRLRVCVATRDRDATPEKELGERAHAGAGDTHEMNWSRVA